MKSLTVDRRVKDLLTDAEIGQFLAAARKGIHGERDYLLGLMAYRHGFRGSELIDMRLEEVDLKSAGLHVREVSASRLDEVSQECCVRHAAFERFTAEEKREKS